MEFVRVTGLNRRDMVLPKKYENVLVAKKFDIIFDFDFDPGILRILKFDILKPFFLIEKQIIENSIQKHVQNSYTVVLKFCNIFFQSCYFCMEKTYYYLTKWQLSS